MTHSRNFVNPTTAFHTKNIDCAGVYGKAWFEHARGAGRFLQSHLDQRCWRRIRRNAAGGLVEAF